MSVTRRGTGWAASGLLVLCLTASLSTVARGQAVTRDTYRVNGVRFDVVTMQLPGDPARIAEALSADGLKPIRRGSVWTLGRQRGSLHEIVELRQGDRPGVVDGRVAIIDLARRPADPAALPFRLPAGLSQTRVVEDLGAAGRPVVSLIVSRVGVVASWRRLQAALEAAGFSAAARTPDDAGRAAGGLVFEARNTTASLEGVIQARATGASVVLVHLRQPREGAHARR